MNKNQKMRCRWSFPGLLPLLLLPSLSWAQTEDKTESEPSSYNQFPVLSQPSLELPTLPHTQSEREESLLAEADSFLLRHEPMYFAYGIPLSKLQFSFRAPVIRKVPFYF